MKGMQKCQFSVSRAVGAAGQIRAIVNQDSVRRSPGRDRSSNEAVGADSPIPPIPLSPIRRQPDPSR